MPNYDLKTIQEDTREILGLYFDDAEGGQLEKGRMGITEIKAYGEPAEFCNVPWLAIMRGNEIWQRIPAGRVRIVYKIKEDY